MNSTHLLSRPVAGTTSTTNELLVLWQHPETRRIGAIGRLQRHDEAYSFAYTSGAAQIDGFRPLLGFPDLRQRYNSQRLPALFAQRVMSRDRPDFATYLASIGLTPQEATPWEQIVQSGGMRAGDTLQFMEVPTVSNGIARARFLVNGIRHVPTCDHRIDDRPVAVTLESQEAAFGRLSPGDAVAIKAETGNPQDACACMVVESNTPLGWVPQAISADIRELIDAGSLEARVVRVAPPGTPPHLRLVVGLQAEAPDSFTFDQAGLWAPLVD